MIPLTLALINTSFLDFNRNMDLAPEDEVIIVSDGFNFDVGFYWEGSWHSLTPLDDKVIGWRILDEDR